MINKITLIFVAMTFLFCTSHVFAEKPYNKKDRLVERVPVEYEKEFGDQNTKTGDIFKFKDFDLKYLGQVELTEKEKQLKKVANELGEDGGNSMLSPSSLFMITNKSGIKIEAKLMMLPYAKFQFEIQSHKFELGNVIANHPRWIIKVLK